MRLINVLSYSLPSLALALAACGDGGGPPAKFASATEAQRQRAVIAGSGLDGAFGYLMGGFISATPADSRCPTVVQSGSTFTATFNCNDDDGDRIDGRVIATNVPAIFGGGPETDPTQDAVIRFEGYHAHAATPAEEFVFDGMVTVRADNVMVTALDASLQGVSVRTDATFRRTGDRTTADEGSTIELEGVGLATIEGAWNSASDAPAGALELHGADVLRADYAAMVNGCVPLSVDGVAAGQLCDGSSSE